MGVYVGVAIAFMAGGFIATHFGWRTVFLAVGTVGLPLAVLVRWTVRELPRGFSEALNTEQAARSSLIEILGELARNRSFVLIISATAMQSVMGYGFMIWGPAFLMRVHGMNLLEAGYYLGSAMGVMGTIGVYLGGVWADRMGRRDERWYMRLPALQTLVLIPFAYVFLLADGAMMSLLAFCPFYLLGAMYVGPMNSMIQGLVVPNQRATSSAVNLFVVNMIGMGLGPLLIGMLNDFLAPDYGEGAIRYSMMGATLVGIASSATFWLSSRTLREDLAAARQRARTQAQPIS